MIHIRNVLSSVMIPEWRQSWKYLTVQLSGLYAAVSAAWPLLPEDQKVYVLSKLGYDGVGALALLGFVSIVVARWKHQPALPASDVNTVRELASYLSVRVSALGAVAAAAWLTLPQDVQNQVLALLPAGVSPNAIATGAFVAVIAGRLKNQNVVLTDEPAQAQ